MVDSFIFLLDSPLLWCNTISDNIITELIEACHSSNKSGKHPEFIQFLFPWDSEEMTFRYRAAEVIVRVHTTDKHDWTTYSTMDWNCVLCVHLKNGYRKLLMWLMMNELRRNRLDNQIHPMLKGNSKKLGETGRMYLKTQRTDAYMDWMRISWCAEIEY